MTTRIADPVRRTPEERRELREKVKRINAEAEANWHDPMWRHDMAAALTETIYLGFEHESLIDYMTQTEYVDFNDRVLVKEVKGLRAFWVARGGHIEQSSLKAEVFEVPRDTLGFHVREFEDKIQTNFAETQQTLIDLGIQRMDAEVNRRLLALLQAAVPVGGPQYLHANGLSLATLNTALREVRDESREFEVTLLGRSLMTDQIIDLLQNGNFTGFLPETNEEMLRRGSLGVYRGARIVQIKNYRDDFDVPFFPGNELWVMGRDASKFAFFGGLKSKEYTEDTNWYWGYLARRDVGGVVHRPNRLRRIVDDTIPAYTIVEQ